MPIASKLVGATLPTVLPSTDTVTLGAKTVLSGATVTTASTVDGGGNALTIGGNADVDDAITNVTTVNVGGTSNLGGDVISTGAQTYTGAVTLSGGDRTVNIFDTVAINCGQGIEAGWSTGANSPIVNVTGSLCIGNHIGWRFGDNYDWDYTGFLTVEDSMALSNDRDV